MNTTSNANWLDGYVLWTETADGRLAPYACYSKNGKRLKSRLNTVTKLWFARLDNTKYKASNDPDVSWIWKNLNKEIQISEGLCGRVIFKGFIGHWREKLLDGQN